jgi:hypothetical protein
MAFCLVKHRGDFTFTFTLQCFSWYLLVNYLTEWNMHECHTVFCGGGQGERYDWMLSWWPKRILFNFWEVFGG